MSSSESLPRTPPHKRKGLKIVSRVWYLYPNLKTIFTDPQYELVAPKVVGLLGDIMRKVLVNGLATQFCVLPNVTRKFLPDDVEQWGKLRRLEGGDIMHARDIVSKRMDGRDASFICVRE